MLERLLNKTQNLWHSASQLPMLHRVLLGGASLTLFLSLLSVTLGSWWMLFYGLLVVAGVLLLLVGVNALVRRLERRNGSALAGALQHDNEPSIIPDEERQQALVEIREQWTRSLGELDRAGMHVYSMPWFMLIGEPGSGKTTTLRNSGIEFPVGTEALSGFGGTRNCDWWFTNEAVILDTAGRFTFEERNAPDRDQWNEFLKLLQRFRPRGPINGVLVAIPATSLLQDSEEELERKARHIRDKLLHLETELEVQFPVFFLVTKCDLVLGFNEFFSRLPALEQRQLFGWSKPHPYDAPVDHAIWPEVFSDVHQSLDRWRLRFLSEDPDSGDVDALYALPDEFAALEAPLTTTLQEIFVDNRYVDPLFLRGVYFTSGMQKGEPIAKACAELLGHSSDGDSRHLSETFEKSTAFFIRDFYTRKLFRERGLIRPTRKAQKRRQLVQRIGFSTAAGLGLILTFLTVYGGYRQSQAVSEPRDTLAALVETQASVSTSEWLERAEEFTQSVENVAAGSLSHNFFQRWAGGEQLDTLLAELTQVETELLARGLFRRLGQEAKLAFHQAPGDGQDYLLYEAAARNVIALLRQSTEPPSATAAQDATGDVANATADSDSTDAGSSIAPLIAFLTARQSQLAKLDEFTELYRRLMQLHHAAELPRPDFVQSFAPGEGEVNALTHKLLDNIGGYWQQILRGQHPLSPAESRALGSDLATPILWRRIAALEQTLSMTATQLSAHNGSLPDTTDAARANLKTWLAAVDGLTSESHATAQGYLQSLAELRTLIGDGTALLDPQRCHAVLDSRWRHALDQLGELSAGCGVRLEDWRKRLDAAGQSQSVLTLLENSRKKPSEIHPAVVTIGDIDAEGMRPLQFSSTQQSDLITQCAERVRETLAVSFDPKGIATLHVDLPAQLKENRSATQGAEGIGADNPLANALRQQLRLANATLLTSQLQAYRHYLVSASDDKLSAIATFMPRNAESQITLMHLGSRPVEVDSRLQREIAGKFLRHCADLLRLLGSQRELLLDGEAKRFQAAMLVACREYFDAYRTGWGEVIGSFVAELDDLEEASWKEFARHFKKEGFGVASTAADIGERFAKLVKIARTALDFSEWLHVEDQDPLNPELRQILDDKIVRYFANFLEAYPPQDNVEDQLGNAYADMARVIKTLSASFQKQEDRFLALLKPAADGAQLPRELLARCEERILSSDALRADELTGELLRIVQLPRKILERELTDNFEQRWQRFGDRFYSRLSGRYPFENQDASGKPAPDVPQATFRSLYTELRSQVRPWLPFLTAKEDRSAQVRLRLSRPEILEFCDRIDQWGNFLGFSKGVSRELAVQFTANYHDSALSTSLDSVSTERTDLQAIIGSVADQHTFGGGISPKASFTWHFDSSSSPTLSFTLLRLGQLDESTRWPSTVVHPPGWLTLPRLLLEYSDQDWMQSRRTEGDTTPPNEWVVRQLTKLADRGEKQYVMYYHFALPEDRGLPAKPELLVTGWGESR